VDILCPEGLVPRPPEQVVEEIAWCVESLGVADVAFYDDALLANAENHIHPILDGILRRGLQVRFHTPNGLHARFIDRALARQMRDVGFVTVRLGLEPVAPWGSLRDKGKVDERSFAQAVEALFAARFSAREVAAYVLIARPGQSLDDARSTARFAQGLGVPVKTAQYSPVPGTHEFGEAVAAGYLPEDADPLLHNNSLYACEHAEQWEALKREIGEANRRLT
jgi:radical SAM superfamily enzyme YgiQ (UPF0313 family)